MFAFDETAERAVFRIFEDEIDFFCGGDVEYFGDLEDIGVVEQLDEADFTFELGDAGRGAGEFAQADSLDCILLPGPVVDAQVNHGGRPRADLRTKPVAVDFLQPVRVLRAAVLVEMYHGRELATPSEHFGIVP